MARGRGRGRGRGGGRGRPREAGAEDDDSSGSEAEEQTRKGEIRPCFWMLTSKPVGTAREAGRGPCTANFLAPSC